MSESWNRQTEYPHGETTLSQTDARQGKTGMGVRYVLAVSLGLLVIAFAAMYLYFFS